MVGQAFPAAGLGVAVYRVRTKWEKSKPGTSLLGNAAGLSHPFGASGPHPLGGGGGKGLHVVDEFAGVVSVGRGMMDGNRDRQKRVRPLRKVLAEGDDGRQEGRFRGLHMGHAGKTQPRQRGHGAAVGRSAPVWPGRL